MCGDLGGVFGDGTCCAGRVDTSCAEIVVGKEPREIGCLVCGPCFGGGLTGYRNAALGE